MVDSWPGVDVKSKIRALCSLFFFILLSGFSLNRLVVLAARDDFTILTEVQDYFFEDTFPISYKDGFRVAACITTVGELVETEDPEVGTIEFYIKGWDSTTSPFTSIDSNHECVRRTILTSTGVTLTPCSTR